MTGKHPVRPGQLAAGRARPAAGSEGGLLAGALPAGSSGRQPAASLPGGDPVRLAIRQAVLRTLLAGTVFSVLTGPVKQVAVLYDHAPWLNDPYDTAVSFAMFFVPLVTACCLARLPLCRAAAPLPVSRARDLLRGCRVVLVVMALTELAEWVSVAARANRPQWNGATWLQIGFLALLTALITMAGAYLHRIAAWSRAARQASASGDWLTDAVEVAARVSRRLGPPGRPAVSVLNWADRHLLTAVRRHPVWSAAAASAAFGAAAGGWQALREGYASLAAVLVITLLSCGMFAFAVTAGSYVGLIRAPAPLSGARRRALDAVVVTCFGLLVVLALRNSLWWIVGSTALTARLPHLCELLGLAAAVFFTVTFAAQSLRGSHRLRSGT